MNYNWIRDLRVASGRVSRVNTLTRALSLSLFLQSTHARLRESSQGCTPLLPHVFSPTLSSFLSIPLFVFYPPLISGPSTPTGCKGECGCVFLCMCTLVPGTGRMWMFPVPRIPTLSGIKWVTFTIYHLWWDNKSQKQKGKSCVDTNVRSHRNMADVNIKLP